jgi:CheY-specific phosphatase CheX
MTPDSHRPDLRRIGESAFTEVLSTLLPLSSTVGNPATHTGLADARDQITGSVLLTGPRLSGSVHVQLPRGFVTHAIHVLTGFDVAAAEANGLLDDTAGELANMVAGRVATRLAEDGYACALGTPSVCRKSLLPFEHQTAVEHGRAELICEGHRLGVEIQCRYAAP